MIFGGDHGQSEAPFTTAVGVFRVALVTFAREVANRDPQLAATAFATAEAPRCKPPAGGSRWSRVVGVMISLIIQQGRFQL